MWGVLPNQQEPKGSGEPGQFMAFRTIPGESAALAKIHNILPSQGSLMLPFYNNILFELQTSNLYLECWCTHSSDATYRLDVIVGTAHLRLGGPRALPVACKDVCYKARQGLSSHLHSLSRKS